MAYINGKEILFSPNVVTVRSVGNEKLVQLIDGTLTDLTAEDLAGLTVIRANCFRNCESLKSIEIPEGVVEIQTYAFSDCHSLGTVILPDSLTTIGIAAFGWVYGALVELTIPKNVKEIQRNAFQATRTLKTITLKPTTPPTLGTGAFLEADVLESIIVPTGCAETYKAATNWSEYADLIVEEMTT